MMRQPQSNEAAKRTKHRRGEEMPVYWLAAVVAALLFISGLVYLFDHTV
jgi:hypothetical protein